MDLELAALRDVGSVAGVAQPDILARLDRESFLAQVEHLAQIGVTEINPICFGFVRDGA